MLMVWVIQLGEMLDPVGFFSVLSTPQVFPYPETNRAKSTDRENKLDQMTFTASSSRHSQSDPPLQVTCL